MAAKTILAHLNFSCFSVLRLAGCWLDATIFRLLSSWFEGSGGYALPLAGADEEEAGILSLADLMGRLAGTDRDPPGCGGLPDPDVARDCAFSFCIADYCMASWFDFRPLPNIVLVALVFYRTEFRKVAAFVAASFARQL